MSEENLGWKCPTCRKVHAPAIKECSDCNQKESAQPKDTRQLLTEDAVIINRLQRAPERIGFQIEGTLV